MELTTPVLIIIAIILIAIVLWLLFGNWGKRREEPSASPAPSRSVNLPPSPDVPVPDDTATVSSAAAGTVSVPKATVGVPEEPAAPVASYTFPSEEITEAGPLDADVITHEVVDADVMRTEVASRAADLPLDMAEVDDLEIIEGIGPKIRAVLNDAGISRFAQLAAMEPVTISEILRDAGLRLADTHSWPEQARLAANGDMEGLKALQDRLNAGRA